MCSQQQQQQWKTCRANFLTVNKSVTSEAHAQMCNFVARGGYNASQKLGSYPVNDVFDSALPTRI